jgi:hypothetical protein
MAPGFTATWIQFSESPGKNNFETHGCQVNRGFFAF